MGPYQRVLVALGFYSAQNVLMEMKLSSLSTVSILLIAYPMMIALSLGRLAVMHQGGEQVIWPQEPTTIALVLAIGVIWYFGDYYYISAFVYEGKAEVIATIIIALPVGVYAMKTLWLCLAGMQVSPPSVGTIVGYLMVATGIWIVVKN